MKRTPLRRKTPLRQIRRAGPDLEREPRAIAYSPRPADAPRAVMGGALAGPAPKTEPMLQHSGYMAAVRNLGYCMNCGRACRPQFCHADQGKGMGIKTDVRRGWPGCQECHWLIGTSGTYSKQERRGIEARLAHKTRAAVIAAGTWPVRLPMWKEA